MLKLHQTFLYIVTVAVALFFSGNNGIRYVLPVLRITSFFHIMGRMARERRDYSVTA